MTADYSAYRDSVYALNIGQSDIAGHLPILEKYAAYCERILELGVRNCHSTNAFLTGLAGRSWENEGLSETNFNSKALYSIDLYESPTVAHLKKIFLPPIWHFICISSIGEEINNLVPEKVDMVFFDTLHTSDHLRKELQLHGKRATRYLAFHDTATCWDKDVTGPDKNAEGIGRAIVEFMDANPEWRTVYQSKEFHGLLVLQNVKNFPIDS